jgi:hypothetical protein
MWSTGTRVYLEAFHEEQQPLDPSVLAEPSELLARAAWRDWEVDLEGTLPLRELTGLRGRARMASFITCATTALCSSASWLPTSAARRSTERRPQASKRVIDVVGVLQVLTPFARETR